MSANELASVREGNKNRKGCKEEDDVAAEIKQWRDRVKK
jgi:hypothetical protein